MFKLINIATGQTDMIADKKDEAEALAAVANDDGIIYRIEGPLESRQYFELSQSEMADIMGVNVLTWIKWEQGSRKMNAAAVRLLEVLTELKKNGVLSEYIDGLKKK